MTNFYLLLPCNLFCIHSLTPTLSKQQITEWVSSNQVTSNWWVGLTDKSQEGDFVWESGHPLTIQHWDSGEPNDYGAGEDCAVLGWGEHGKLNDYPCTADYKAEVVCQKSKQQERDLMGSIV